MDLAHWLERRRLEDHLSRQDFAATLGLSASVYSQIALGKQRPTLRVVVAAMRRWPERANEIADVVMADAA